MRTANKDGLFLISQQSPADKAMLEKMRKKLSVPRTLERVPGATVPFPPKRHRKNQSYIKWVLCAFVLLVGANTYLILNSNELMEKFGFKKTITLASPTANSSLEERAWFWAYAAFQPENFHARYPYAKAAIVPINAKHHLQIILPQLSKPLQQQIQALEIKPH